MHQLIIAENTLCDSKFPRVPGRYPHHRHRRRPTYCGVRSIDTNHCGKRLERHTSSFEPHPGLPIKSILRPARAAVVVIGHNVAVRAV